MVRPAANDTVLIKRFLDSGAQSLLIPQIANGSRGPSRRHPPHGICLVSALARATRFGRAKGYFEHGAGEICLTVQIETQAAFGNLEAIATAPGVDALFAGPADLAASLGYGAEQTQPAMHAKLIEAIARTMATGKPADLPTGDVVLQKMAAEAGVERLSMGLDAGVLARGQKRP